MKSILLLITIIFSLNSFSQSKKDQIEILTQQIDSVKKVLNLGVNSEIIVFYQFLFTGIMMFGYLFFSNKSLAITKSIFLLISSVLR